jgi:GGDEF domain-containing protein
MADIIQNYSLTLKNKVIERTKELNEKDVELQNSIEYRKKAEKNLLYMSYHDCLTETYNRRIYEEELNRLDTKRNGTKRNLPLTIVMGDVNGCRTDDIIARLGGDEFVIILPETDAEGAEQIIKRINELSLKEEVATTGISISFGYPTKSNEEKNI